MNFKAIKHRSVSLYSECYTNENSGENRSFDITIPFEFKSNYSVEGLAFKNKNQIDHIRHMVNTSNDYLSISYNFCADENVKNKIK